MSRAEQKQAKKRRRAKPRTCAKVEAMPLSSRSHIDLEVFFSQLRTDYIADYEAIFIQNDEKRSLKDFCRSYNPVFKDTFGLSLREEDFELEDLKRVVLVLARATYQRFKSPWFATSTPVSAKVKIEPKLE